MTVTTLAPGFTHRRPYALRALVVLALLLAAAALPASGSAHGGGLPAHQVGQFNCGQGLVQAYPPRQMLSSFETNFRNPELIFWTPVLFRYNDGARAWEQVAWPGRWYRAFTSSYGYYQAPLHAAWSDTVTNGGIGFLPFSNLARGWYAVVNWMYWGTARQMHSEPSSVCYVQ